MTGSIDLYRSAIGHGQFAASQAPARVWKAPYAIMGFACSLAFGFGAKWRKDVFKEVGSSRMITAKTSRNGSIGADDGVIDGLAVVIPALVKTKDQVEMLQQAIDSIGTESSVIVVDDGSPCILKTLLTGCIVARHNKNLGPAAARNTGVAVALDAGASAIALTDSDCFPDVKWAHHHAALQASAPGIWGGRTIASDSDIVSEFHDRTGTLMPRLLTPTSSVALYAPTCNLSISREVAKALQFDPSFPTSAFEDVDFCIRARQKNFEIKVSDLPVVRHAFDAGLFGMLRQYYKYGKSYPLLLERHPGYPKALFHSMPQNALSPRTSPTVPARLPVAGEARRGTSLAPSGTSPTRPHKKMKLH